MHNVGSPRNSGYRSSGASTCSRNTSAMIVLAPGIFEVIGDSQREERLELLDGRMAERGIDKDHHAWYRDLRRSGTVPPFLSNPLRRRHYQWLIKQHKAAGRPFENGRSGNPAEERRHRLLIEL